jgi:hypothetical protein
MSTNSFPINLRALRLRDYRLEFEILEQKYGKYIFVPFDIPPIRAKNINDFSNWYLENCLHTTGPQGLHKSSNPDWSSITVHYQNENYFKLKEAFPEIIDLMQEHLPYTENNKIDLAFMTNNYPVPSHRDHSNYFIDIPGSIRSFAYDDNPISNLYLIENRKNKDRGEFNCDGIPLKGFAIPRLETTNTFSWNNLRAEHGSIKIGSHKKILCYYTNLNTMDWKRFDQLIERSIKKYYDQCFVSDKSLDYFINDQLQY